MNLTALEVSLHRDTGGTTPLPTVFSRPAIFNPLAASVAEVLQLDIKNGPWLAGGSLLRQRESKTDYPDSYDYDFWFRSEEQFIAADEKLRSLAGVTEIITTENARTYEVRSPLTMSSIKVQLIKRRFFDNTTALLDGFDFHICKIVSDGVFVLTHSDTQNDVKTRTLRSNKDLVNTPGGISRIVKYVARGYKLAPDLKKHLFDHINDVDWTSQGITTYDAVGS